MEAQLELLSSAAAELRMGTQAPVGRGERVPRAGGSATDVPKRSAAQSSRWRSCSSRSRSFAVRWRGLRLHGGRRRRAGGVVGAFLPPVPHGEVRELRSGGRERERALKGHCFY